MNDSLGRAFNPSVLFMMAMPFAVVGAMAGGLVYAYRRALKNTDMMNERGQVANAEGRDAHQQDLSSEQSPLKISST